MTKNSKLSAPGVKEAEELLRAAQIRAGVAAEHGDCVKALLALSAIGYPTPLEGYGTNSSWAISDLCRALSAPAASHANDPLTVGVEDNHFVIRIGVDTLAEAFHRSDENNPYDDEKCSFHQSFRVIDAKKFAKGVGIAIQDESENGSTPLTRILDAAFIEAVESDMGIQEIEHD